MSSPLTGWTKGRQLSARGLGFLVAHQSKKAYHAVGCVICLLPSTASLDNVANHVTPSPSTKSLVSMQAQEHQSDPKHSCDLYIYYSQLFIDSTLAAKALYADMVGMVRLGGRGFAPEPPA